MAFTPQSNLADVNMDQIPPGADAVSGSSFLVKVPAYFTPVCGGLVVAVC